MLGLPCRRSIALVSLASTIGLCCCHYSRNAHAQADTAELATRQNKWSTWLKGKQRDFTDNEIGLITSIERFRGDYQLHIVVDPKRRGMIEYRVVRDGRVILTLQGHFDSPLLIDGGHLYFADYSPASSGCAIEAYNLDTGNREWRTELHHERPGGHSAYSNNVTMGLNTKGLVKDESAGSAIIVMGSESYCDYMEILDRQTGESLAIKNYRVGKDPSEEDADTK
jgi:hypothetical protein